jgi:uncharacterized protein (DUF1684 family)
VYRITLLLLLLSPAGHAQDFTDSLTRWRHEYKNAFITDEHSPLKAADTGFLRFYPIRKEYRVVARVMRTPESAVFALPTYSGITKRYKQWGIARFSLGGRWHTLHIYQSPDLVKQPGLEDNLSIFFNDLTNYKETYAGGRYLDLKTSDIKNGLLVLDFNKAYNPYCAYSEGYNCPVPPAENRLPIAIRAGEQMYAGPHKEKAHSK